MVAVGYKGRLCLLTTIPGQGLMAPDVMAREAVDLLLNGGQGEIRAKRAADEPAIWVDEPNLAPS